jgi:hypothetical protein
MHETFFILLTRLVSCDACAPLAKFLVVSGTNSGNEFLVLAILTSAEVTKDGFNIIAMTFEHETSCQITVVVDPVGTTAVVIVEDGAQWVQFGGTIIFHTWVIVFVCGIFSEAFDPPDGVSGS